MEHQSGLCAGWSRISDETHATEVGMFPRQIYCGLSHLLQLNVGTILWY
jgi:hypothetical protein